MELTLNFINTFCQIALTITAIIAIIVTLNQIQNKSKSKLKVSYKCGMGFDEKFERSIGISINIINIGLGPVYYDYCGFIFVDDKKYSSKKLIQV